MIRNLHQVSSYHAELIVWVWAENWWSWIRCSNLNLHPWATAHLNRLSGWRKKRKSCQLTLIDKQQTMRSVAPSFLFWMFLSDIGLHWLTNWHSESSLICLSWVGGPGLKSRAWPNIVTPAILTTWMIRVMSLTSVRNTLRTMNLFAVRAFSAMSSAGAGEVRAVSGW